MFEIQVQFGSFLNDIFLEYLTFGHEVGDICIILYIYIIHPPPYVWKNLQNFFFDFGGVPP